LHYDTKESIELASDNYWDGSNWDRNGRNTFLYKTQKGRFFKYITTRWQGERDYIVPLCLEDAKDCYESLPEHEISWKAAFGYDPDEA